jgi:hypothetical protein
MVVGQLIQYGLWQQKFLMVFTMALGYAGAASSGPRSERSAPGVSLSAAP